MKKTSLKKRCFIILLILFCYILSYNGIKTDFISALTPHPSISINSDAGFSGFPGTGTGIDPYLIEGYNITTTNSQGIEISGTTKHFHISNCYIDADDYGIYISNIADGTATIRNNTCENNNVDGIFLVSSNNNTLSKNNCSNNNLYGIYLEDSSYNTLSENNCTNNVHGIYLYSSSKDNTLIENNCTNNVHGIYVYYSSNNNTLSKNNCSNNNKEGIYLTSSRFNSLIENNCTNNDYGIYFYYSSNNTLIENNCSNNNLVGIDLYSSNNNTLSKNNCSENYWYGIYLSFSSNSNTLSENNCSENNYNGINLYNSNYAVINDNFLHDNGIHGVDISSISSNNLIYGNTFDSNNLGSTSQAIDDGEDNQWFDQLSLQGNYWSDWTGGYYYIDGSANAVDHYPFEYPLAAPVIEDVTHSPSIPTNFDVITISATIIDPSGIDSVTLHYRINAGGWLVSSMTLSTGSTYQTTIGIFTVYTVISYYITAVDNSSHHHEAIEDNSGLYYQFTVIQGDISPPTITDVSHEPSDPNDLETITISATVGDSSGIDSVTLHYRINGGSWSTVSMTLSTGSIYQATIGPFNDADNIEYYITAVDNSTNNNQATDDNSGLFYSFTVLSIIPEYAQSTMVIAILAISLISISYSIKRKY